MKKIVVVVLALGLFVCSGISTKVMAQIWKRQIPTEEAKEARKKEMAAQADSLLTSKEWVVYWTLADVKKKTTVVTDIITFSAGKIKSKYLAEQGYNPSNYTLSMTDEGVAIFETMQVNENLDKVFIRAELNGGVLGGVISMRPKKGKRTVYHFSNLQP